MSVVIMSRTICMQDVITVITTSMPVLLLLDSPQTTR